MPRKDRSIGDVAIWACVGFAIGSIPTGILCVASPRDKAELASKNLKWLYDLTQWIFALQAVWWALPFVCALSAFGSIRRIGSEWLLYGGVIGYFVGFTLIPDRFWGPPSPIQTPAFGSLIGILAVCLKIAVIDPPDEHN